MDQKDILRSPQAEQLLKNKEKIIEMMNSPDAQRLISLLQRSGGNQLEGAAQAALQGKPDQLMQIMQSVMANPEGAKTVERINKELPK